MLERPSYQVTKNNEKQQRPIQSDRFIAEFTTIQHKWNYVFLSISFGTKVFAESLFCDYSISRFQKYFLL